MLETRDSSDVGKQTSREATSQAVDGKRIANGFVNRTLPHFPDGSLEPVTLFPTRTASIFILSFPLFLYAGSPPSAERRLSFILYVFSIF